MSVEPLPAKDSQDLYLVVATPEEHHAMQHVNSEEWRGALSLEAYLRREKFLFSQEFTKDGGSTAWMLVYQPDLAGPRQVLCGCESQNRPALVARNGSIENVTCHSIASVFCPPEFRGKGYAGRMMTEVGRRLREWQAEEGKENLFSVLFSDIGKQFYAARGWQPFPSTHVALPAAPTQTPAHVRLLQDADLPELCEQDERLMRQRLATIASEDRSAVAVIPQYRIIRWHQAREEFVAQELKGRIPEIKGAMVGDTPGSRVWAYWTRVWTNPQEQAPNTLHILRLVIEDETYSGFLPASTTNVTEAKSSQVAQAIAAIMAVAQAQATEWDMREVQIWNPTAVTLGAAQLIDPSAAVIEREEESITSLLWFGQGSWKDVDWMCNEKYGWC